ncbi:MAG TPA: hypothetical protein VJX29_09225, partial [Candidatus Acidoferrales bacterium]|nr:hypothetical protein [Candidatus Acidoferrales bacterium]
LVDELARENIYARRQEIRKVRQARLFWKGKQYIWWSERDQAFHTPFDTSWTQSDDTGDDMPRYQYVTNIYQPFGLSLMAALSQTVPATRLFPESPTDERDITTAKAGTKVIEYLERSNDARGLLQDTAFYLYTDGKVGGYVRYVVDGQRFGFNVQEVFEEAEVVLTAAKALCPECGWEGEEQAAAAVQTAEQESALDRDPVEDDAAESAAAAGGAGSEERRLKARAACPQCGAALSDADMTPAETVRVPRRAGVERVPNGQEVISIVGALELKTPLWAREQFEFPYLIWGIEAHISKLKAAYPHVADKITPGGLGGDQEYERIARLTVAQGSTMIEQTGDVLANLVTFQRAWLRPWAFYAIDDLPTRQQLLALFPDGCYVAFAGETYCESRNEGMDDHWRVVHAMPGDGQDRPALGESLISVQERLNDLANIAIETYEYGIPSTFVDAEIIDLEALEEQTNAPGAMYPVHPRPGQPVGAGFYATPQAQLSPDMLRHMADLFGPISQFLTGAFPALFGGEMENTKTASGYAMARDQAMGRLGLPWGRIRKFYSDLMLLALECFRRNRVEDMELPVVSSSGDWSAETIHLADLAGRVRVYPEADENFPVSWTQQKQSLFQLMQVMGNDPAFKQAMSDPENMAVLKRLVGLDDLALPGDEARVKQFREIARLLLEPPQVFTDSLTGVLRVEPSIRPDVFADDHAAELATCRRWMSSDDGQRAKMANPQGFANVRAHAIAHYRALSAQAAGMSPLPPPMVVPGAAAQTASSTPPSVASEAPSPAAETELS